ncbi:MAG: GntR family transcriptional regulator [Thermoanaerobaculia bacterium]|nr:GntR family transcriptional regulator [Thermoanaerobaculia bacterium]
MNIHVSPKDGAPLYLQIMRQIRYLAASGRLEAGQQLPPVRKLAEQLLVNPNTVARAYRELETEGVLVTRPGAGVFLAGNGSPLARPARLRILSERIDMLLSEARQMNIGLEEVVELLHERERHLAKPEDPK